MLCWLGSKGWNFLTFLCLYWGLMTWMDKTKLVSLVIICIFINGLKFFVFFIICYLSSIYFYELHLCFIYWIQVVGFCFLMISTYYFFYYEIVAYQIMRLWLGSDLVYLFRRNFLWENWTIIWAYVSELKCGLHWWIFPQFYVLIVIVVNYRWRGRLTWFMVEGVLDWWGWYPTKFMMEVVMFLGN